MGVGQKESDSTLVGGAVAGDKGGNAGGVEEGDLPQVDDQAGYARCVNLP